MLYGAIMEFIVQLGSCFISQVKNTWRYDISKKKNNLDYTKNFKLHLDSINFAIIYIRN